MKSLLYHITHQVLMDISCCVGTRLPTFFRSPVYSANSQTNAHCRRKGPKVQFVPPKTFMCLKTFLSDCYIEVKIILANFILDFLNHFTVQW